MSDNRQRVLEIQWDVPGLPRLVGPFDSEDEAVKWGDRNIPNGTWEVRPLALPYAQRNRRLPEDAGASS